MSEKNKSFRYEAFAASQSEAHAALIALGRSVDNGGLDKRLTELVKLRVSQMNGCAFCIQLHLNIARNLGIEENKLGLLPAWRAADIFSQREQEALRWAEFLTLLEDDEAREEKWARLCECFDEREATLLTISVGTINAWNRIAGGMHFDPPISRSSLA
jgi:AhpD family alkylhydroperoxidase